MTDKNFHLLFGEALTASDRDTFVSDWATSSLFLDPEDETQELDPELIDRLGEIFDVAHMDVKALRATTGLSQAAFADRFCIPRRTVENWELRGGCPDYVRLMMAQLLGLIHR